jgi:serine/threonine protein phosphatase PrpC
MSWKFGAAMDIGGRDEQQDRLTILTSLDERRHLIALADGMGGLRNGAHAAQIAVDTAVHNFPNKPACDPHIALNDICQAAHRAINALQTGSEDPPGTTLLLLYIDEQQAYWAHVGDSRLYHFRNGRVLTQTTDHSIVQLMIAKGMLEPDSDAAKVLQNRLYMRLGGNPLPTPDFAASAVEDGDLFLLCSDGFWQTVRPHEVIAALGGHPPDHDKARYLADLARKRGGEFCDNISLVLFQWNDRPAKKALKQLAGIFRKPASTTEKTNGRKL